MIRIHKIDNAWLRVECEDGIHQELTDLLTFEVPGYKFMPAYRNRHWDGKIRLLDRRTHKAYYGLYAKIINFAKEHGYSIHVPRSMVDLAEPGYTQAEAEKFVKRLKLPVVPHDYQYDAFLSAVRYGRRFLVSPTGSGKSLIAYMIMCYFKEKTLIIVPTISLVRQMATDFQDYGFKGKIHQVTAGVEKSTNKTLTISTWQSIAKQNKVFFKDFRLVVGDEAHLFNAKSLVAIMTKMTHTPHRFGMTGTLTGALVHALVLEGLFGGIDKVVSTKELIDRGTLSALDIKILVLSHPDRLRSAVLSGNYQNELLQIVESKPRLKYLCKLALALKGNTLILYALVEKHGQNIYDDIVNSNINPDKVFFIHGGVGAEDREEVRAILEVSTGNIIVASYGTFSTGINIKNLHNIIFASPTKSRIRTLQSIGRGLRLADTKDKCVLYDIADDFSRGADKNYTLKHLMERVKMYSSEGFPFTLYNIKIGSNK